MTTIDLLYRREPPPGVRCFTFRNVTGRKLELMPPGGGEPIRIDAGGRMLIPEDDLARSPDLIQWLFWACLRRLLDREGITGGG